MSALTMRASRLLSILITLQLRGRVPASELARQFEVSKRTIYRDVEELSGAGVPVYAQHGAADDVVPPAFSRDYVSVKQKMKEDARLVEIAGAGHFEVVDPRAEAWREVERVVVEAVG